MGLEQLSAQERFAGMQDLANCEYPGRVIVMGRNVPGDMILQAYALTGRSEPSQNRVFVPGKAPGAVNVVAPGKTEAEMAEEPMAPLIYYPAMKSHNMVHVVTNGAQTPYILDRLTVRRKPIVSLQEAAEGAPIVHVETPTGPQNIDLSAFEPDDPNFTPRISGVVDFRNTALTGFGLIVARRRPDSTQTEYGVAETSSPHNLQPGDGYGVRTYLANGNPLPSYDQVPFGFKMGVGAEDTAETLWDMLPADYRVSVVVKAISANTGTLLGEPVIINRHAA